MQQVLFGQLVTAATGKRTLALGMEMVQRPFQMVLDDYIAGVIDESTMLVEVQWNALWGYDYSYYRPTVQEAVGAHLSLRALNAPVAVTDQVANMGISSLTPDQRAEIAPNLDFTNAAHRAWFMQAISGDPQHDPLPPENVYDVQVIWDSTMAWSAWQWLTMATPTRAQIAILAGTGHCIDLGIPLRLQQLGVTNVVSVRPAAIGADLSAAYAEGLSDYIVIIDR